MDKAAVINAMNNLKIQTDIMKPRNIAVEILILFIKPILIFSGCACIWYFCAIINYTGYINAFNLIWIFAGLFIILIVVLNKFIKKLFQKMHKIIRVIFSGLILLILLSFIIIETLILINARTSNSENADNLIILGAGLYRGGPSLTLLRRIDTAIDYLEKNPETKIIASGGKGSWQSLSEAEIISGVLQNNGMDISGIILEDKSANTYENIKYSANLIKNPGEKLVIASSEFHLFRAKIIANRIGYKNTGILASQTPRILQLNYYVREYFAVIKTLLFDK